MEEKCKELDFALATNSPSCLCSALSSCGDDLSVLSQRKLELVTDNKYLEHISELLTYYTVTSEDFSSNFYTSLHAQVAATNKRIEEKVNNLNLTSLFQILPCF